MCFWRRRLRGLGFSARKSSVLFRGEGLGLGVAPPGFLECDVMQSTLNFHSCENEVGRSSRFVGSVFRVQEFERGM